jgi:hypothetical protein
MASEMYVDTIAASDGTSPVTLTKQATAKAFIQYSDVDGTFDETFNASSTTDNGSGDANYGLTSSMSNANYPASGEAGGNYSSYYSRIIGHAGSTASSVRIRATNSGTYSAGTSFRVSSIIFGDLA